MDAVVGKDASCLMPLATSLFYAIENNGVYAITMIGGISTTVDAEVRTDEGGIIPRLFAIGVDGAELRRGLYTIETLCERSSSPSDQGALRQRNESFLQNLPLGECGKSQWITVPR